VRERRLGALANQLATLSSELRPDEPEHRSEASYLQRLSFKHGERTIVLRATEMIWIEAEDYYVRIHSSRGRHLVRTPLAVLEARLDSQQFLRVHRGAIVNLQSVVEARDAGGLTLVLSDGSEVPVSRSKRGTVEAALLPHLNARRPV
jgi:two-component system, LytTR family, response regulator